MKKDIKKITTQIFAIIGIITLLSLAVVGAKTIITVNEVKAKASDKNDNNVEIKLLYLTNSSQVVPSRYSRLPLLVNIRPVSWLKQVWVNQLLRIDVTYKWTPLPSLGEFDSFTPVAI